jgi:hypothetical protein
MSHSSHLDLVVLAHVAGTSVAAKGVTACNQEATYPQLSWSPGRELWGFGSEGGGGLILAAQATVDQDSGSVGGSVLGLLGFQCGRWGFFSVQRTVLSLTRF